MKKICFLLKASVFSFQAAAAEGTQGKLIDFDKLYVGAGLGINSLSGWDSATGYQFYAGAPLGIDVGGFKWSVEAGYMDSGSFSQSSFFGSFSTKAAGLWGTAVFEKPINETLGFVGRAGMDIGDDDGVMYGAGVTYNLSPGSDVRFEYVLRANVTSMQANYVYLLK